jgi:hypothetical protein
MHCVIHGTGNYIEIILIDSSAKMLYHQIEKLPEIIMKKIICLVIYITVLAGSIFGQNQAKIDQIQKQIEQLFNDYTAKKITADVFNQRLAELQNDIKAAFDEGTDSRPVDGKRLELLLDQYNTLTASHNDKKISDTEYAAKAQPLADEIKILEGNGKPLSAANYAIVNEARENIKKLWPGSIPGWPPSEGKDSIKELIGLGPFVQSAGTKASYNFTRNGFNGPVNSFSIYQTGAVQTVFQNLKSQIERITGKPMEKVNSITGDFYRIWVPNPGRDGTGINLDLEIKGNAVLFSISKLKE